MVVRRTNTFRSLWLPLSLSIFGLVLAGYFSGIGRGQRLPKYKRMLKYDDFKDRVEVIGRLGVPLGQFADVRGTWVPDADKGIDDLGFRIDTVNGNKLDSPVIFPQKRMKDWNLYRGAEGSSGPYVPLVFATGQTWDMRGFESAWTVGYPPGVAFKAGENSNGEKPSPAWEFESRFGYLTATLVKPEKNN